MEHRGFLGSKNTLYDAIMINTCLVLLSRPIELTTPRVKPNVTYGLWVTMMCQRRFISYNKRTLRLGMCTVREEEGIYGKSLYLSLSFLNLKLIKKKSLKKYHRDVLDKINIIMITRNFSS